MTYQTRRKKSNKKRKKRSKTKKHPKGGIRPSILLTSFMYFLKNNNKINYNKNLFSQNPKETSSYPQEPYLSKGPIELFSPPSRSNKFKNKKKSKKSKKSKRTKRTNQIH
jgi:hypothetical protein